MNNISSVYDAGSNPEQILEEQIQFFVDSGKESVLFAIRFQFSQYYLSPVTCVDLLALVGLSKSSESLEVRAVVDQRSNIEPILSAQDATLETVARQINAPLFNLSESLLLQPVSIPKPWGQEIWYTGIEERGLSRVGDGENYIPLPWLLALAPNRLTNGLHQHLNLLKILDPLAEEVYGDLYFELHEKKQEVYVVTHVDKEAWPDGVGAIRFGFNPEVMASFDSDAEFKQAYQDAVNDFRAVRREVDELVNQQRLEQGIALDEPVNAEQLKKWQLALPAALVEKETLLRMEMERFSAIKPLQLGDVVIVPTLTPHSLQHGVRTVEFQTPVYERKILSFGQKVLTQAEWDTEEAVDMMLLDSPDLPKLEKLEVTAGYTIEQVVRFDDFLVRRITLEAKASWDVISTGDYALLMSVNGGVSVQGQQLSSEQAVMLPAQRGGISVQSLLREPVILLVAEPI